MTSFEFIINIKLIFGSSDDYTKSNTIGNAAKSLQFLVIVIADPIVRRGVRDLHDLNSSQECVMHVPCIPFNVTDSGLRLEIACNIGALWVLSTFVLNESLEFISIPQVDGKCSSTGENIVNDTNKLAIIEVHRNSAPFFNCGNLKFPLKIDERNMGKVVLFLYGLQRVRQVPVQVKLYPKICKSLFKLGACATLQAPLHSGFSCETACSHRNHEQLAFPLCSTHRSIHVESAAS